jgi:hypothetical protein
MAKKQKVTASSDGIGKSETNDEEEFASFVDDAPHDEKAATAPGQNIEEGWEEVERAENPTKVDSDPIPLDEEPVQIEGTKEKMAKVLDANEEAASQALDVPNMLSKDW